MKFKIIVATALVLLTACVTVLDETRKTVVLPDGYYNAGEPYEIVTQRIQGQNGTYERTQVVYWGRSAMCIADSPGDCEAVARRLIDQRFSVGLF